MNTSIPGPSPLAGSISKAISAASSTTGGGSGSPPFAGWVVIGDAAFDPNRAVAAKGRYEKIEVSFDTGHLVELGLLDNESGSKLLRDWIGGGNITSKVKVVSITNP